MDNTPSLQIGFDGHYVVCLWGGRRETGAPFGKLGDITTAGLLILGPEPVDANQDFSLEIRWEDERGQPAKIPFTARSCWCRRDLNPDFYGTGYSITDLAPEAYARLRLLIARLAFDEAA